MSKKANPAAIGAFVLVAIAIGLSALVVLGSGKLFKKTSRFVIFFESSLSGLDVGAPVEYRGVRIGQVKEISLQYNFQMNQVLIPVYVDLEDARFKFAGDQQENKPITHHIEHGLRAQLESQSLLTGKMKVMLVDDPDAPMRLVGGDPETIEIPAIPTLVENISHRIEKLPIVQIISNLDISMKHIADVTSSGELTNTVLRLNGALKEIEDLGRQLNKEMPGLLATARENGDRFLQTQTDLEDLSNSLRNLIDYLQMHPEALLSGKKEE